MPLGITEQVVEGPGGERVDLHHAVALVPFDEPGVGAQGVVLAPDARDPGLVGGELAVDRVDLAQLAAQPRVAVVQLGAVLGVLLGDALQGQHVDDAGVDRRGERVPGAVGLREVVAGVEEEHVDARTDAGDQVGQDGVARHGACDGQRRTERLRRPGDDLLGGGVPESRRPLRGEGPELLAGAGRPRAVGGDGHRSASSSTRWAQAANVSSASFVVANRRTTRST